MGDVLVSVNVPTFVKWAGGKTRLLGQFRNLFPRKIERYLEPFVGSGAVFFYIKKHYNTKEVVLSDVNKELINCYKIVRDKPNELIESLKLHMANHNEEYYYRMRNNEPNDITDVGNAARFIYLNKTCFNGLYRVNSKGKFNVPIGKYKRPNIVNEQSTREASRILAGVELKALPFEKTSSLARGGDFVYFDPPYLPLSKTSSFTGYTNNSFSEHDQKRLSKTFRKLDKRGCLLMLSNSNHHLIQELYSGYKIEKVKAGRAICCDPTKRGKITELVVMNY